MRREQLRQVRSLLMEIEEEERRRETLGAWSLFHDDAAARARNENTLREIGAWIEQIPDSLTRRAMKLRYLDGLSWTAVSLQMGYASEAGARMLAERYLEKAGV